MKKVLIFLVMLFLISSVYAFDVKEETIDRVIIPEIDHPAKFAFTITNVVEGEYNFFTLADVRFPVNNYYLNPLANRIELFVYPMEGLNERGFYTFTYNLRGKSLEHDGKLTVKIVNLEDILEVGSESNDHTTGKIKFYIRNKENTRLTNVNMRFSSIFFDINKQINLEPYEILEIETDINPQVKKILAGSYLIKTEIETNAGKKEIEGKIFIGEKKEIKTTEDASGILMRTDTITKINTGSVPETVTIKIKRDILTRLFSSFSPEPDLIERNGLFVYYTWAKKLEPTEILVVKSKTNYLYPFLIIIFIALAFLGFKRYTETKLEVKKSVSFIKAKGGEFALRVNLNVTAKKSVENVSLIDKIPKMVKVYDKFTGMRPTKADAINRRLQWEIGSMNSGEERSFSYVIYSKVGIVGKFALPEALAVFEKDGEIHEIESNRVFFLAEQINRED
ncbi:MAG: hypothetical protein ACOYT4_03495 [Nanoarchaeota archaeon]